MKPFRITVFLFLAFVFLQLGCMGLRAEEAVKTLSLEEKAGQIMMCFFEGPEISPQLRKLISELKIGGVILYSSRGNIVSTEQVSELCESMQSLASASKTWPLFIGIDQEGGLIMRITEGVTLFPGNMALGAANDENLAAEAAGVIARELASLGINMNFAPVADVNNNPLNPVIGVRSFGSSPDLVSRLASAMAASFSREGIIPSAKHFPGHGNTGTDSHTGLPLISSTREELEKNEIPPFRALIMAGVETVMTAHVLVPALDGTLPATLSPTILGMLRKEMGFPGVIITDSLGMGALKKNRTIAESAVEAFNAGADILLFGADKGYEEKEHFAVYETLLEACRSGRISQQRLDEAVGRILELKKGFSLFGRQDGASNEKTSDTEGEMISAKVAENSITLVRSWDKASERIRKNEEIPLIWPENHIASGRKLAEDCPFFTLCIVPEKPEKNDICLIKEKMRGKDIVFAAEYDSWKNNCWLDMLENIGQEKLFILSARTPYSLLSLPDVRGFFALYSDVPSTMTALGKILNGKSQPKGKLPVELPGFYPYGWGEETF